jgi:hypothetical protein
MFFTHQRITAIAVVGSISFGFCWSAQAEIGPGVYRMLGGVTGENPNVCWVEQSLSNGFWTDTSGPRRGIDLVADFQGSSHSVLLIKDGGFINERLGRDRVITRFKPVPCPPPAPPSPGTALDTITLNGGFLGGGAVETSSKTTVKSPTDKQTKGDPTTQAILFGEIDLGRWFLTSQLTFAGTPHGNFSDVFPAFPAANVSATVNSGQLYGFVADAGYVVYNRDGWKVGVFGGYYAYDEFDYGMFPGFAASFPILATQWRSGEGGVSVDKKFMIGAEPFDLNVTAAGLRDHLQAGLFSGTGGGARVNGRLSFPLGPVVANIIGQYSEMNASSSNTGVPLTFKTQTWYVGGGISYAFGGDPAAPASMVFKAPSK